MTRTTANAVRCAVIAPGGPSVAASCRVAAVAALLLLLGADQAAAMQSWCPDPPSVDTATAERSVRFAPAWDLSRPDPFRAVPCGSTESRQATPPDRWLAEDKLMHFFMSYATTGLAYAAARTAGVDRDVALGGAVGVSALVGLGKEWHDRRNGGTFSFKDLVWDGLGLGVGALVVAQVR